MIYNILFFYFGWGAIWSFYCVMSTIIHPSFSQLELTVFDWIKNTAHSTVAWPWIMAKQLQVMQKEAQKYKDEDRL
jgi:hypothetical protein